MATVIHERGDYPEKTEVVREYHDTDAGNGLGAIVGVIFGIILLALLLFYGLPYLRGAATNNGSSIPNRIDVNLNTPGTNNGGGTGTVTP